MDRDGGGRGPRDRRRDGIRRRAGEAARPAGAATQQMEKGQTQRGQTQGRMKKGERAQGMQAQSPQAQATTAQEHMGQQRMGQQRNEKPGMENRAAQGQRPGAERMNQAQTERPKTNAETGQPAQGQRMQSAPQTGQTNPPAQTAKGAAARQNNAQATGTHTRTGGVATAQGQQRTTHVNPQQVHVTGNTRITNDKAAQLSDTLLATARPQNVNVAVNVGAPLPGEINLLPLPANIVDIVPEFRGYDYVVVNDEIVIVQPSTRKVVEMINTGGATVMNAGGAQAMAGTRLNPCGTP
jgi:Protein of unknown function (DUF1236)